MDIIVAVYDDWGIGCCGTQPVAVQADRTFFRKTTSGAAVIVGRKTLADFPGGRPLPKRRNIVLTRQDIAIDGCEIAHSPEEAAAMVGQDRAFVIGGGSVYEQMLPLCERVYVTKVHTTIPCDTYFRDLDQDPQWKAAQLLQQGEEDGLAFDMWLYERV